MPIGLEPDATFEVVLKGQEGRPEPATFVFRYLSMRDWKAVGEAWDHVGEKVGDLEVPLTLGGWMDQLLEALRKPLAGWRNVTRDGAEVAYDPGQLDAILAPYQVKELLRSFIEASTLGPDSKKGSGSQSPSASDRSADIATRLLAVETALANLNPSASSAPCAPPQDASIARPTADSTSPGAPTDSSTERSAP